MNKEYILTTVDGEQLTETTADETTAGETEATTEESAYANIKDEAASLPEALQLAWQGMLGIFIVALIIIAVTSLLNAVTSKKNKKAEQ